MGRGSSDEKASLPTASKDQVPARKKRKRKPAGFPKRPLSAYNVFFRETRDKLLSTWKEGGGKEDEKLGFTGMGQAIAERWRALDAEGRERFEKLAEKDKIRYREEVKIFEQEHAKKCGEIKELEGKIGASINPGGGQVETPLNMQNTVSLYGGPLVASQPNLTNGTLGNMTSLMSPGTALHQQQLANARRLLGIGSADPALLPNFPHSLPPYENLAQRLLNQEEFWQRQRLLEQLKLVELERLRTQQLGRIMDVLTQGASFRHPTGSLPGVASTAPTAALGSQVANDSAQQMILEDYARRVRVQEADTSAPRQSAPAPP